MLRKSTCVVLLLLLTLPAGFVQAQTRTVGRMYFDNAQTWPGYTLFTPFLKRVQYLINNCGEVVHQWQSDAFVTHAVYLMEDGRLFRMHPDRIQIANWEGSIDFEFVNPEGSFHHDACILPNGNLLVQTNIRRTDNEAIEAGRLPQFMPGNGVLEEQIWEINPNLNGGEVVWRWSLWDHVIQDQDTGKANYGQVEEHPELMDINYVEGAFGDFWHPNGLDYHPELDQIMISSRSNNEFYIIDHSTTKTEAQGHTGGRYGKGGDFLYRWGNPEAYDAGTPADRILFGQHNAHWIPDSLRDGSSVLLFNNGWERDPDYSEILTLYLPQSAPGVYYLEPNGQFGPPVPDAVYQATTPTDFYSEALSGVQRLPNGNTLVCEGNYGRFFELNPDNEIVWEYVNPHSYFGPLEQGEIPDRIATFRAEKYGLDFPGFVGKDLTPQGPIELNPIPGDSCELKYVPPPIVPTEPIPFVVYPNPVEDRLFVQYESEGLVEPMEIKLVDAMGKKIMTATFQPGDAITLEVTDLLPGMYLMEVSSGKWSQWTRVVRAR